MNDRRYWLFRTLDNYHCLENDTVNYGWSDYDLYEDFKDCEYSDLKDEFGYRAPEVRNCLEIKEGDIVIMPLKWNGGIAIAEVLSEHIKHSDSEELYERDMSNYYEVKWITEFYDRTDLPAEVQTTLKYRRSNLNIDYYSDYFEGIIKNCINGINSDEENYGKLVAEQRLKDISLIYEIISNRNAKMSDTDFEKFVLEFFETVYNLKGSKNSSHYEVNDGADLFLFADNYSQLGLDKISWNVQVKQHWGETEANAIEQISKSDNSNPFVFNVVVTSAKFSENAVLLAKENNVILIDGKSLSELIYDNFDKISIFYKRKLGLISSMNRIQ